MDVHVAQAGDEKPPSAVDAIGARRYRGFARGTDGGNPAAHQDHRLVRLEDATSEVDHRDVRDRDGGRHGQAQERFRKHHAEGNASASGRVRLFRVMAQPRFCGRGSLDTSSKYFAKATIPPEAWRQSKFSLGAW